MSRPIRRHRRKRNSGRTSVVLLILVILVAIGVLAAVFLKVNTSVLRDRISAVFSRHSEPQVTSTPEPTPAPEPIYFPNDADVIPRLEPFATPADISFSVDGRKYNHSTYFLFGNDKYVCAKLSELSDFLGFQTEYDSDLGMYSFSYHGKEAVFYADTSAIFIDGDAVLLRYAAVPFNRGTDLYVTVEDVLSAFYASHIVNEEGIVNFSDFSNDFPLQKDREIPIISYYSVTDDPAMEQYLVPSESVLPLDFSAQLQFIKDNGYTAIRFEDLADLANIVKPVMLTFDGCWMDLYTVVFPLIQQYGVPINVFVWPDYLGTGGHITEDQLKEMAASDLVSVQAGSEIYRALESLSQEDMAANVLKAKSYVSALIGREPLAFSYPATGASGAAQTFCSSEFRFCLRRHGERPFNTTIDDGSVIYQYTIQRGTPVAMLSYWLSRSI